MTSIAESPDCHRGLVRGCVTSMVKYAARGTAFASSSLGLSCLLNRRFQDQGHLPQLPPPGRRWRHRCRRILRQWSQARTARIAKTPLTSHGVIYFKDKLSRVFGGTYSCTWDGPIRFQPEEVAAGTFMTVVEVFQKADAGEKITPDSREALRHYLSQLTER